MGKIHLLSEDIIGKIAAGEVIERPAFAVKELIENAIDAKASRIEISIEQSGLKKIQITDDGEGMEKEDLEMSWKPHTTSKLPDNNLLGISSFGFRGEALASLAAVSNLIIKSRTLENPTGNQIEINNGVYKKIIPIGMPSGTTVIAENLFNALPARKKFLKSPQTEFRHIVDIVNSFAIIYPNISFLLRHNNKIILNVPSVKTNEQRIEKVFGATSFSFFLPVESSDSPIMLSGYIAKPQLTTSTQNKQLLFVNKRKVTDKMISLAVKEAFGTMLESTAYPLFVLFLELPLEMVDINVHPRKEQVAFFNSQTIFHLVKTVVLETLQKNNITFQNLSWKRIGVGTTNSFAAQFLRQEVLNKESFILNKKSSLVQVHNTYIVAPTKTGITFVDQHAAHERILFEKLIKVFMQKKRKYQTFQFPNPPVFDVTTTEGLVLKEHEKILHKFGYTIRFITKQKIVLTDVPLLFQDRNPKEIVKYMVEIAEKNLMEKSIDKVSEEMIAFLACRAAVKAGDILPEEQMKKILKDLEDTPNNATCPHARPTQVLLSYQHLNALFKR